VSLKFFGISGRLTDWWYCFLNQFANWSRKHVPGARAAGNDLIGRLGLAIVK